MANYSADYLTRLLDAVTSFQSAFDTWMEGRVRSHVLRPRPLPDGVDQGG